MRHDIENFVKPATSKEPTEGSDNDFGSSNKSPEGGSSPECVMEFTANQKKEPSNSELDDIEDIGKHADSTESDRSIAEEKIKMRRYGTMKKGDGVNRLQDAMNFQEQVKPEAKEDEEDDFDIDSPSQAAEPEEFADHIIDDEEFGVDSGSHD